MTVTHVAVGRVIEHIFTMKPNVSDTFVGFGLEGEYFKAECICNVFDAMSEGQGEPERQGMQIWMFFRHTDNTRMNLSKFSWSEVLDMCNRLQEEINWGFLRPLLVNEHTIEIALYRSIDISMSDIRMALDRDLNSEFLRMFKRLSNEWEELSPVFSGVSTGQITSVDGIELLMQEVVGEA